MQKNVKSLYRRMFYVIFSVARWSSSSCTTACHQPKHYTAKKVRKKINQNVERWDLANAYVNVVECFSIVIRLNLSSSSWYSVFAREIASHLAFTWLVLRMYSTSSCFSVPFPFIIILLCCFLIIHLSNIVFSSSKIKSFGFVFLELRVAWKSVLPTYSSSAPHTHPHFTYTQTVGATRTERRSLLYLEYLSVFVVRLSYTFKFYFRLSLYFLFFLFTLLFRLFISQAFNIVVLSFLFS